MKILLTLNCFERKSLTCGAVKHMRESAVSKTRTLGAVSERLSKRLRFPTTCSRFWSSFSFSFSARVSTSRTFDASAVKREVISGNFDIEDLNPVQRNIETQPN